MTEYWYNINSGQVEEGAKSSWKHLLGPYTTHGEAARALDRVQRNNQQWEEGPDDADGQDDEDDDAPEY